MVHKTSRIMEIQCFACAHCLNSEVHVHQTHPLYVYVLCVIWFVYCVQHDAVCLVGCCA